jgi:hypothetical protein
MAIPPSFGGSVFAVRCDPCGGMKESWFTERGDVMSWLHPEQHNFVLDFRLDGRSDEVPSDQSAAMPAV